MIKNFIIVGTQRTGSTALYHSLNFHPAIACGGEWTQKIPWHKKIKIAEQALQGNFTGLSPRNQKLICSVFHDQTQWLGFKMLFRSSDKWILHPRYAPALQIDQLEGCLRWVCKQPEMQVIHIVRKDAMEWLKSKYLSSATGFFAVRRYPEGFKVTIPLRAAIRRLKAKNWIDKRLSTLAKNNPYLRIHYEDFLQDNQAVIVSMMQFLQCDPNRMRPIDYGTQQKQSEKDSSAYIANYHELMTELKRLDLLCSPFSSF